ncbi:MAG: conjugative relaxase domain protein [Acidobacteria bacterium]|nr:conjugative relaxase domain protein [Acidobacteriota bacterium]
MMTMSTALSAGQAKDYYQAEYTSTQESYYTEDENVKGEWFGKQAEEWGLEGEVEKESFEHLCEGQDPRTGLQLVRHVTSKEYENAYGEMVETSEHRAGWDATFSAPKSVSLAALVGGDERIMEAHDRSVNAALTELEKYVQARIGGNNPAETTGKMIAAKFEHDAARPDRATGYAAPQLHTHVVTFNLTQTEDGRIKPIQPLELYRSQQYATAIYRTVLAAELQKLGYEVTVDARTGAPEINGFSKEYLAASSPRRQEIEQEAAEMKERMAQQGINVEAGAGLRQAAAKTDRMSKRYDRKEMRARHWEMDTQFGEQAVRVAESAQRRGSVITDGDEIKSRAQSAVTFARENAGEREAVVDKRRVMVDALRRNLGFTTYDAVLRELNERVESGEFIRLIRNGSMEELTTSRTVAMERSNIQQVVTGRGTQEPILEGEGSGLIIGEIAAGQGITLNESQRKALETILESHDRIVGLQGLAGTGKTTTLAVLRGAVEGQGYEVEGFAPTGAAADLLAESGIKTSTLQKFVVTPQMESDSGKKILYIMDESSLSDTRNMFLFFKKAGPVARLLLVGDTGQHQAVEAGAPFEQFVKAGMQTATLDEIVRQKSDLKIPVEQLSKKDVLSAVRTLSEQGRITEIADDGDRLTAIAKDYLSNPKGTLVISPANEERVAINSIVHRQLQAQGIVSQDDHELRVLVNRQDMTGAERTFALAYVPGEDIIRYNKSSKLYTIKAGDYGHVLDANHRDNTITVGLEGGREITYNPERLSGVSVYKEAERSFAQGDRIQFRAPFAEAKVKNSELGTITEIADGKLTVALARKRVITFDPARFRHLDHGYAVTSYSAQGKTMDRVLVNAETTETDMLLNQRMAYVAMSRARFDARVYTDSTVDLGGALNRLKDKEMALEALKQSQPVTSNATSNELPVTAVQTQEGSAFDKPEEVTQAGPRKLGKVPSDLFSIARLRGQAIVAESSVAVSEKRCQEFEKSKHFANFEIDGEQWSLVSVDQQQRGKEREIEFNKRTVSAYRNRLYGVIHNPIKLYGIRDYKERAAKAKGRIKHAREEIKQLQPIRERVTELIEERRGMLRNDIGQQTQSARTLNRAVAVEVDLHFKNGQQIPQPEFNGQELDQLNENATTLRDPQMLKAAQDYLEGQYGQTPEGVKKLAARAASVEASAEASLRGASERIHRFVESREFFPVLYKGADGQETTASLNELALKTLGEKVASYFSPSQRLEIDAVQQALEQHHTDLLQERDTLQQFAQGAGEIAETYREKLQMLNPVIQQPQFTVEEVGGIENLAAQQTVASLDTQFELTIGRITTGGAAVASITNPAQQAAQGVDLGMAHQQSMADDHLEQARQRLDKVSAESVAANETGMGAGMAVDTGAAGSQAFAALL